MTRKKEKFCNEQCAKDYYAKNDLPKEKIDIELYKEVETEHLKTIEWFKENIKGRLFGETDEKYTEAFETANYTGRILCIVNAGFRCEKCKTPSRLTLHHLITRRAKQYMEFNRYVTQRYFYKNITCLCTKCHTQYHSGEAGWNETLVPIPEDYIKDLKETFVIEEKQETAT